MSAVVGKDLVRLTVTASEFIGGENKPCSLLVGNEGLWAALTRLTHSATDVRHDGSLLLCACIRWSKTARQQLAELIQIRRNFCLRMDLTIQQLHKKYFLREPGLSFQSAILLEHPLSMPLYATLRLISAGRY